MAEVPRDPRQLARDILSGKIKIEDLARERQRQAGGGAGGIRPAGTGVPAKIPLPRPVSEVPRAAPMPRPPVKRAPPVPVRTTRPAAQVPMPGRGAGGGGPRIEAKLPQRPTVELPSKVREEVQVPAGQAQAYSQTTDVRTGPGPAMGRLRKATKLKEMIKDKESLRQGILMAEILGKPLALREPGR